MLLSTSCFRKTTIATSDDGPTDQWSRGVWLYSNNCASCHGEHGEGGEDVPAIAGEGALPRQAVDEESARTVTFDNARDVLDYVRDTMPPLDTGCLTDDQLHAVMNYVLKQADISAPETVTPDNIAKIRLR